MVHCEIRCKSQKNPTTQTFAVPPLCFWCTYQMSTFITKYNEKKGTRSQILQIAQQTKGPLLNKTSSSEVNTTTPLNPIGCKDFSLQKQTHNHSSFRYSKLKKDLHVYMAFGYSETLKPHVRYIFMISKAKDELPEAVPDCLAMQLFPPHFTEPALHHLHLVRRSSSQGGSQLMESRCGPGLPLKHLRYRKQQVMKAWGWGHSGSLCCCQ